MLKRPSAVPSYSTIRLHVSSSHRHFPTTTSDSNTRPHPDPENRASHLRGQTDCQERERGSITAFNAFNSIPLLHNETGKGRT